MNCERAVPLISMRLDGEIPAADRDRLDRHLAGCPDCRATAEAFAGQDRELRRAFGPRRRAAQAMPERVGALLPASAGPGSDPGPSRPNAPAPGMRSRMLLALGAIAAA